MAAVGAIAAAARLSVLPPMFASSPRTTLSPSLPRHQFSRCRRKRRQALLPISSSLVQEGLELSFTEPEMALIEALIGVQGRGRKASPEQLQEVERAVRTLEDLEGVSDPTRSSLIEGRWQLLFTTRPGTASPIQRTFVGVDFFKIFQEVYLNSKDQRVSNIVRFSDSVGELKVEAAATVKDGKRILFQFDRAAFSFKFLPFKVPYPVPFKLLGDEAKGWLDTTYLSTTGNVRISRGNKGTTFVLQKKIEPRQRLLAAISVGEGVEEIIYELTSSQIVAKEESETLPGEWQLLWASKSENKSQSDIAVYGVQGLQMIENDGCLQNQVDVLPGLKICANGKLIKKRKNLNTIEVNDGAFLFGGIKVPLEAAAEYDMELLYIDKKIRITKCNKDTLLVHLRVGGTKPRERTK